MGQCSTLPADKNKPENGRNNMPPSTPTRSTRRGHKQQREQRDDSYHGDDRHQYDGDVVMGDVPYSPKASSRRDVNKMMAVAKESNHKFEPFMKDDAEETASHPSQSTRYHSTNSSRSSSRVSRRSAAVPREEFFPPPEGSVRTRCYRLNLDVPVVLSPTHDSLGPFHYKAPVHLLPNSDRMINYSLSTESVEKSQTQVAVDTARIFRGIKVDTNGTIVSRNDRASRSRKGGNSSKTAENSRQSAKINKANDLVDDLASGGKENDGEKQNLVSIFPLGEYDDMKQLVRDGAKKLREAKDLPDENILSLNRHRGSPRHSSRRSSTEYLASPSSSSRRRLTSSPYQETPRSPESVSSSHRSLSRNRRPMPQSVPPKIKGHPRDRPSSRRMGVGSDERNSNYGEKCNNIGLFGGGDSDWSEALNFNSIWTCGATGTGTMSPSSNNDSGRMSSKARYEGRNESSTRFSRGGGGASERDAPLIL